MGNNSKQPLQPIAVNNGVRSKLIEEFHSSFRTVREALDGTRLTPRHVEIRRRALELGGMIIDQDIEGLTPVYFAHGEA